MENTQDINMKIIQSYKESICYTELHFNTLEDYAKFLIPFYKKELEEKDYLIMNDLLNQDLIYKYYGNVDKIIINGCSPSNYRTNHIITEQILRCKDLGLLTRGCGRRQNAIYWKEEEEEVLHLLALNIEPQLLDKRILEAEYKLKFWGKRLELLRKQKTIKEAQ